MAYYRSQGLSFMAMQTIILVDHDPALRAQLARLLHENGYQVRSASTAPELWAAFNGSMASLILLEMALPGTNGIDLCRRIRRVSDIPIIFTSSKGDHEDKILGLEIGADDYVVKPLHLRELVARIRAVLRRGAMNDECCESDNVARFAGWTVYKGKREVQAPTGELVDLTGAEFDLLGTFIENPERVICRDRLVELSRRRVADSSDRSIDVLVSRLRRKLAKGCPLPPIVTVRSLGYMLNAKVSHS